MRGELRTPGGDPGPPGNSQYQDLARDTMDTVYTVYRVICTAGSHPLPSQGGLNYRYLQWTMAKQTPVRTVFPSMFEESGQVVLTPL